ncbi:MAG: tryptophan--tRNA ligase [Bacillota bacterium]
MKERIFSGMRPSGRLHLGNLLGALDNWIRLQDDYQCFFGVVDWHALTTGYEDTSDLRENVGEMVLDWLAAGIDPERSVILRQSDIKEHAELHLLLSMVTPLSWLERVPTYKEQLRELEGREIATYGFLGYPVLQAADIFMYRATRVPVGEDQLPHLELSREIARRFNNLFGPVFPEPEAILNKVTLLPGIDGRKMSKSYQNEIPLAASPEVILDRVSMMITDPARVRRNDPGHPEVCTVYSFHGVFGKETLSQLDEECRSAGIGCVQCKKNLGRLMGEFLEPIRSRREDLAADPDLVRSVLEEGASRARAVAQETMGEVREAMRL